MSEAIATETTTTTNPAAPAEPAVEATTTQAADPAPETETPAEPVYDLKLSDGSPLKPEDLAATVEFAKANKLSPEQAQAALARSESVLSSYQEAQQKHLDGVHAQWLKDVEADPEIGGARLQETTENAQLAFKHFGSEKLGEALEKSKLGNHPEFVRFASKIGALLKNDRSVHSNTTAAERSPADILYGGMK